MTELPKRIWVYGYTDPCEYGGWDYDDEGMGGIEYVPASELEEAKEKERCVYAAAIADCSKLERDNAALRSELAKVKRESVRVDVLKRWTWTMLNSTRATDRNGGVHFSYHHVGLMWRNLINRRAFRASKGEKE